jgi:anti-repressor protein
MTGEEMMRTIGTGFGNIRVIEQDGNVWFIAKDICDILEIRNIQQAVVFLERSESIIMGGLDRSGRRQSIECVNESGVYGLIAMSKKKGVSKFRQDFVNTVMPEIRGGDKGVVEQKQGSEKVCEVGQQSNSGQDQGIRIFENEEFGKVRVVEKDGEPWFYASDVAEALGYERPGNAINEHCRKACKISQLPKSGNRPPVNFNIIPEQDVYRLIMRSNLPSAGRFQDWVCEEVLPSIRKHGAYLSPDVLAQTIADPTYIIGIVTALKQEQDARKLAEQKIAIDAPSTKLGNAIRNSEDTISSYEMANLIGQAIKADFGNKRLCQYMRMNGYLHKHQRRGVNIISRKGIDAGLIEPSLETLQTGQQVFVPRFTGKGQEYFINKFLKMSGVELVRYLKLA